MAGLAIVLVLALVVIAWVAFAAFRGKVREREQVDAELHEERVPTLEYAVPTGQDPVVILTALEREGYTATVDATHPQQVVLIACPGGVDRQRAHLRAVIESASVTTPQDGVPLEHDVRFLDEP